MVYRGAPNVQQYSPAPRSFIDVNDFPSVGALGRHLKKLLTNDSLYESYFEWRLSHDADAREVTPALATAHEHASVFAPCRLCLAVADMRAARRLLTELDLVPQPGNTKVTWRELQGRLLLEPPALHIEWLRLWDLAYGRVWRADNHKTDWNDWDYAYTRRWEGLALDLLSRLIPTVRNIIVQMWPENYVRQTTQTTDIL